MFQDLEIKLYRLAQFFFPTSTNKVGFLTRSAKQKNIKPMMYPVDHDLPTLIMSKYLTWSKIATKI